MALPTADQLVAGYKAGGNLTVDQIVGNSPTLATATPTGNYNNTSNSGNQNLQNSINAGNIPTTISSDSLQKVNPLNIPSSTPFPTTAVGVNASSAININQYKNAADKAQADYLAQAKAQNDTGQQAALNYLNQGKAISEEALAAQQSPEFLAKKQNALDTAAALEKNQQAQKAEIEALDTANMTDAGRAAATQAINHHYALENANLSVTADIANKNYVSAQDTINNIAKLKSEAIQPFINYYESFLGSNQADLNNAEKDIVQNKIDFYKNQQTQTVDNTKANGDAMIKYNSLGAGITTNDTAEQRNQKIASVGGELAYYNKQQESQFRNSKAGTTPTPTTPSSVKFTSTQINKGASNAGVALKSFKAFEPDTQNYFVNLSTAKAKGINDAINNVKNGTENADDVKAEIDASLAPPAAKEYLKQKIDASVPQEKPEGFWGKVVNFFTQQ
jgi:hypothetical protein